MFKIKNLLSNDDVSVVSQKGAMRVLQYERDLSVSPASAQTAYFSSKMNIHKRQIMCELGKNQASGIITQSGAMQWTVGNVQATTGIKGVGDFAKKLGRGMVTNESAIKPEYVGSGVLMLEPTYKHILLVDMNDWNGEIVLEDGMFVACENTVKIKVTARTNVSSALAGGEGLFNIFCTGSGIVALESECPEEELILIELENDVLKIDGNYALAWSKSLDFKVERSGKTLIGSAASGEGLVNTYKGTGKVLLQPIRGIPYNTMPTFNSK